MSYQAAALGPRPVLELFAAGLKVGQEMARRASPDAIWTRRESGPLGCLRRWTLSSLCRWSRFASRQIPSRHGNVQPTFAPVPDLRLVFVGGTRRAVNLLENMLSDRGIDVEYCVFMPGYDDERVHCDRLVELAEAHSICYVVSDVIDSTLVRKVAEIAPDAIIGGGIWRTHIPNEFLELSKYGYLGLHGSRLPAYRGWAGLNWYILNGEQKYGMRFLRLSEHYDAGPLVADSNGNLLEYVIDLDNEKHVGEILEEVHGVHVRAYRDLFTLMRADGLTFVEQDEASASYTCHRGPDDGEIEWNASTTNIFNFIRAQSHPYPGAFTFYKGSKITLWRVKPRYDYENYVGRIAGKVVTRDQDSGRVVILTADGGIEVVAAQPHGGETTERPVDVFTSVRTRCKSRAEAYLDVIRFAVSE